MLVRTARHFRLLSTAIKVSTPAPLSPAFNLFSPTPAAAPLAELLRSLIPPPMECEEAVDSYSYGLPIPGFKKGDIKVVFDGRELSVRAHKGRAGISRVYEASFIAPPNVDVSAVPAVSLDHGVLHVKFMKGGDRAAASFPVPILPHPAEQAAAAPKAPKDKE